MLGENSTSEAPKTKRLRAKQQRFVQEYLVDHNATQAAIRAGYSKKCARQIADKMLSKGHIQEAVAALEAEFRERLNVTVESITKQLLADHAAALELGQAGAAVQASANLAKLHGLIIDRRKVEVAVPESEDEIDREIATLLKEIGDEEDSNSTKH